MNQRQVNPRSILAFFHHFCSHQLSFPVKAYRQRLDNIERQDGIPRRGHDAIPRLRPFGIIIFHIPDTNDRIDCHPCPHYTGKSCIIPQIIIRQITHILIPRTYPDHVDQFVDSTMPSGQRPAIVHIMDAQVTIVVTRNAINRRVLILENNLLGMRSDNRVHLFLTGKETIVDCINTACLSSPKEKEQQDDI